MGKRYSCDLKDDSFHPALTSLNARYNNLSYHGEPSVSEDPKKDEVYINENVREQLDILDAKAWVGDIQNTRIDFKPFWKTPGRKVTMIDFDPHFRNNDIYVNDARSLDIFPFLEVKGKSTLSGSVFFKEYRLEGSNSSTPEPYDYPSVPLEIIILWMTQESLSDVHFQLGEHRITICLPVYYNNSGYTRFFCDAGSIVFRVEGLSQEERMCSILGNLHNHLYTCFSNPSCFSRTTPRLIDLFTLTGFGPMISKYEVLSHFPEEIRSRCSLSDTDMFVKVNKSTLKYRIEEGYKSNIEPSSFFFNVEGNYIIRYKLDDSLLLVKVFTKEYTL